MHEGHGLTDLGIGRFSKIGYGLIQDFLGVLIAMGQGFQTRLTSFYSVYVGVAGLYSSSRSFLAGIFAMIKSEHVASVC